MIPRAYIQAWRAHAPWPSPAQVEQDSNTCSALCDLFSARSLTEDVEPLLPVGVRLDDTVAVEAFNRVWRRLTAGISGSPWNVSEEVVPELRRVHMNLLHDDSTGPCRSGLTDEA